MAKVVLVKVTPKARVSKVEAMEDGSLRVWTNAPPDKGKANEAVQEALAAHFGVAKSAVVLRRGATSRNKEFLIED